MIVSIDVHEISHQEHHNFQNLGVHEILRKIEKNDSPSISQSPFIFSLFHATKFWHIISFTKQKQWKNSRELDM